MPEPRLFTALLAGDLEGGRAVRGAARARHASSPPSTMTGAATHAGRVRKSNEDHYLILPDSGVWAVADGMGGHESGSLASATVADALRSIGAPASAPDL